MTRSREPSDVLGRLDDVVSARRVIARRTRGERPPPATLEQALHLVDGLQRALVHRTTIAQATGIVAERYGLDVGAALAVLRTLSNDLNRKLFSVAEEVVLSCRPSPDSVA